ncbi:MAG TPA: Rne/Rng family ribonuclease [Xanthobacteraceae bacterium]
MPNKMLIDATHPEETRVVVLRGHRVEEFDFESASRKQLRGNIYLAKVTRVEPSLQAAFIDYGGNRHGFLAFSEIHPDYYQIPVADRLALIAEEERAQRDADAEADRQNGRGHRERERGSRRRRDGVRSRPIEPEAEDEPVAMAAGSEHLAPPAGDVELTEPRGPHVPAEPTPPAQAEDVPAAMVPAETPIGLDQLAASSAAEPIPAPSGERAAAPSEAEGSHDEGVSAESYQHEPGPVEPALPDAEPAEADAPAPIEGANNITEVNGGDSEEEEVVESVGGADAMEEVPERMPRLRRQYKIQEVIKRRQVMLVQVVKEERGTKGAALTTYLSLAGRYSVLMPNTARGGGISRKITSLDDRRRLKEIAQELDVPEGMGVILRTAGASRTKTEVKRDFEYLLRLWETVRDLTLKSTAPTLVYEEGSLVKRSIRDLYNKEIDEILVAGDEAWHEAKELMRMLMPSHVKNVKPYRDTLPIFTRYGIENQLDAMFTPVMQLRSGGYIVLNQAEALVAIDVNSGRATREHHIEDTALKTNLEAAEEIARQLRLRDLAGLIVIDFIDMDEKRNNRAVERRLKECLRHDRARIQVGHISHFGLLEMSRQRIRSSVLESSTEKCPHCGGSGHVRSVSSVALQLLRSIEEMLLKGATHNLTVRTRSDIALYLLNQKRAHLRALEERFRIVIMVNADASIGGQVSFVIEKNEQVHSLEQAKALALAAPPPVAEKDEEEEEEEEEEIEEAEEAVEADESQMIAADEQAAAETGPDSAQGRRRRRRRRGRRGTELRDEAAPASAQSAPPASRHEPAEPAGGAAEHLEAESDEAAGAPEAGAEPEAEPAGDGDRRRRRRGRRGGRRNRRDREGEPSTAPSRAPGAGPSHLEDEATAEPEELPQSQVAIAETPSHEPAADMRAEGASTAEHLAAAQAPSVVEPTPAEPVSVSAAAEPPAQPSRRRSTVREPAPTTLSEASSAAPSYESLPEPVVVSSSEEDVSSDRPRRSGLWSRRVLGKG